MSNLRQFWSGVKGVGFFDHYPISSPPDEQKHLHYAGQGPWQLLPVTLKTYSSYQAEQDQTPQNHTQSHDKSDYPPQNPIACARSIGGGIVRGKTRYCQTF